MSTTRHFTLALLAVVALFAAPLSASAEQTKLIWGVNGHPIVSYPGVPIEVQLDALRDLGLTSYRVDVPGMEKVDALAELVREGKKRGIDILPVVTPGFDLDKETPESLHKKAYDLGFALISRFKGDIAVWELGNELDNYAVLKRCESGDNGTPRPCILGDASGKSTSDYSAKRWSKASAVLKGLTEGAHAADPSVRRAIGTAGWGHIAAFELMKADGISWEISIWHMYGQDPEWAFKELAQYERPIWVTEFNNPYGSQRGKEEQVKGLLKTMKRLNELEKTYEVEAAHIYELMDEPYWGKDFESFMGLIEMKKGENGKWQAGDKKPAYAAVKDYIDSIGARPQHQIVVERQCELKPAPTEGTLPAEAVITYAYCLVLGRAPDGAGMEGWSAHLASDMPVDQILIEMMHSDEFERRRDVPMLSKREYVTLIHRLLLGVDAAGPVLAQMVADLEAGKHRTDLERALIASKEFHARHPTLFAKVAPVVRAAVAPAAAPVPEVRRNCDLGVMKRPLEFQRGQLIYSYCLVLGRWPDSYGLRTWLAEMRAGLALKNVLLRLLQSDEFAGRYQIAAMTNADFVTLLYRLLLGRDPDAAGLEAYASKLAVGALSRTQVCEDVLNSDEFQAKQEVLFTALKPERPRAELQKTPD